MARDVISHGFFPPIRLDSMKREIIYKREPIKLNAKYLILIIMAYFTATLAADVVAFKFVDIHGLVISGATIVFPLTYLFGDVITEVYGYNIARQVIWMSLIGELIFALIIRLILLTPYPHFANYQLAYNTAIAPMLMFVIGGVIGNIASSFLNVYLISKWKIILSGKHFWIRSVISTAVSELLIIGVAVAIGFSSRLTLHEEFSVFGWAYILEIIYAFIFVWPAVFVIHFLKNAEGLDSYDVGVSYNPFKVFS